MIKFAAILFVIFNLAALVPQVHAQTILSPETVALGGNTSSASGVTSLYSNPANLMLRSSRRAYSLSGFHIGFQLTEGIRTSDLYNDYEIVQDYYYPNSQTESFANRDQDDILANRFNEEEFIFSNTTNYDIILGGLSWRSNSYAFGLGVRSRGISSFQQNRNWSIPQRTEDENLTVLNRLLSQRVITFHEISVGYAREIELLSGWTASLGRFYMGINPKYIIGGMYFDGHYQSSYIENNGSNSIQSIKNYNTRSVGDYSTVFQSAEIASDYSQAIQSGLTNQSLTEQNGTGLGLDIGLTYIKNIGDDISLRNTEQNQLRKSFAVSIAITDIGYINFDNNAYRVHSSLFDFDDQYPEANNDVFTGRLGQFAEYIANDNSEASILNVKNFTEEDKFMVQLPTTMHLGTHIQYSPIMLMADFKYALNNPDFIKQGIQSSIGAEVRLLRIIPVRGSVIFNPGRDTEYGFGVGVDISILEFSTAIRIRPNPATENLATGFGMAVLTIRM